jgi:DNA modification methylase
MLKDEIIQGDCLEVLKILPSESVDCCITSPPYWGLRDYGVDGQFGLEKTPEEYVAKMVEVFREVKRVLKKEGTCWLNLGDSYASNGGIQQPDRDNSGGFSGSSGNRTQPYSKAKGNFIKPQSIRGNIKPKDLVGIPWRVAFALQADGWYLRQDIIWHKPNPMPESVTDRCTKAHEYIFLLAKSQKYYFDNEAIKEKSVGEEPISRMKIHNGLKQAKLQSLKSTTLGTPANEFRNKRSIWTITTKPFKEAHFATFPEDLITPMVKAGCPENGIVLDPFIGSGTTAVVARKFGRKCLGIELNPAYIKIAEKRLSQSMLI